MTKKELSQIFFLNKEVEMWQKELEKIQCESLIRPQQITDMPRGCGLSDQVFNRIANIDKIERIINGKLAEIQVQRAKIMEYINSVEDSIIRQIMFYRHISCMRWNEVAIHIGGGNSPESVRKSHDRFLEEK
jgi:hypothetical protein